MDKSMATATATSSSNNNCSSIDDQESDIASDRDNGSAAEAVSKTEMTYNKDDYEHDTDVEKQSYQLNDQEKTTRPGVFTVSRDNFSNVQCSDVNRLIAKTRGHASALFPYQGDEQGTCIVDPNTTSMFHNDNNTTTNTPEAARNVSNGTTNPMYVNNNIGTAPTGAHAVVTSPNVSTTQNVSLQVRRLIAKTRGDPEALIPFQNGHSYNSNDDDDDDENKEEEIDAIHTEVDTDFSPGAYAVSSSRNSGNGNTIIHPESNPVVTTEQGNPPPSNENENNEGLAVASPVLMHDDDAIHIPTAVQFDDDEKQKTFVIHCRLHLVVLMISFAFIIGIVGVALGVTLPSKQQQDMNQQQKGLKYRETIGIYENIARLISPNELNDSKSPYKMALDWITHDDPLLLTPDHPRFTQRYLLSYFYFATSIAGNWTDDCAPDSSKRDECIYTPSCAREREVKIPSFRWFSKQDECEWAGIKCDQLQQVMIVDLSAVGMTGFFPQGLTLLPYLHKLRLECGTLTGPIAEQLNGKDIALLSELSLKNNAFTGTIPEQLIQSHSLNKLILQSNQLNGTIPTNLFSLFDLNELNLGSNELTGTLPNELDQLRNIRYLLLENNNFIGTIPSSYDKMKYLLYLYLSDNFITGTIPNEFGNLKKVIDFVAARNRLNGSIPENFWNANLLSNIRLDNNALTGTISNKIQQLKDLTEFSISNNYFTGTIPARIGKASGGSALELGLLYLRAYGNQLNGTVPQHLCNLVQGGTLEALELDCAPAISTEVAEITCPIGCCTLCCTPDGTDCK